MVMLNTPNQSIVEIYQSIESKRRRYGKLKKGEIHFHSPASHDYKLINEKIYKHLTEIEIINHAVELGYLLQSQADTLISEYQKGAFTDPTYLKSIADNDLPFTDFKEYLSYMLIAHTLYKNEIDFAILTDHNTINGYPKLKYALDKYFEEEIKPTNDVKAKCIFLFLGVEISCSDCTHVVGIFDSNNFNTVKSFLEEIIHDEDSNGGTIETSLSVLKKIFQLNGIGYIAHVNSYEGLGTGLYKESLFSYENLNILGTKNLTSKGWKSNLSTSLQRKDFCFLHESDAHSLEELGSRNTWIKMNEINFNSLKKALNNFRICVYPSKPSSTDKFIKGIGIVSKTGFLQSKDDTPFLLDFSKDLNCIIGGRGTGKSTVLNILDIAFTKEAKDLETLKLISKYEIMYIIFHLQNKDYVIRFLPQVNNKLDVDHPDYFLPKAFKKDLNRRLKSVKTRYLSDDWIQLFQIDTQEQGFQATEIKDMHQRNILLNKVYKKHYSINNIINRIQNNSLGEFIQNIVYSGVSNNYFEEAIRFLFDIPPSMFEKKIRQKLIEIEKKLKEVEVLSNEKIASFNTLNPNLIKLSYSPNSHMQHEVYLEELFQGLNLNQKLSNTLIKVEDFIEFIYYHVERMGLLEFLKLFLTKKFEKIEAIYSLKQFSPSALTIKDIEHNRFNISNDNLFGIYEQFHKLIIINKNNVAFCLQKYIDLIIDFNLEFNINSKESAESLPVIYRPVAQLSLGQQVVAILTFIMGYGKLTDDKTPFIIDQPEDNLDNQYIYKNLVASLQNLKNHRQVIVVTHNSTIVTNADAEQVIILESTGTEGYIKKTGYVSDKKIMQQILIHLEGGEEAFKIKTQNYSTVLT